MPDLSEMKGKHNVRFKIVCPSSDYSINNTEAIINSDT